MSSVLRRTTSALAGALAVTFIASTTFVASAAPVGEQGTADPESTSTTESVEEDSDPVTSDPESTGRPTGRDAHEGDNPTVDGNSSVGQQSSQPGGPISQSEAPDASTGVEPEYATTTECNIPSAEFTGTLRGVARLSGASRYETNVAVAKAVDSAPIDEGRAVFIASGRDYADGLTIAALATFAGWPLLLVNSTSIPDGVRQQIKDVNPTHIFIAGGTKAVSNAVESQLVAMGVPDAQVTRFAGGNRYETSRMIADCFPQGQPAFIATGENFADAVIAGAPAADRQGAVILTSKNRLSANARLALEGLQPTEVHIIGGAWTDAEKNKVTAAAKKHASGNKVSLNVHSGKDRHQTSVAVADGLYKGGKDVVYANSQNFADALSGIAAAEVAGAPIILTKTKCRPKSLESITKERSGTKVLLGGTSAVSTASYTTTCVTPPKPKQTKTLISVAKSLIGSKAASGSAATNPTYGFDCSGFTSYVYRQLGKNIPRDSWGQWAKGKKVGNPQPGDIVIMRGGGHVAIYAGNGQIIDSPGYFGAKVQLRPIWGPVSAYVRF